MSTTKTSPSVVISRRLARQSAMQALYQWEMSNIDKQSILHTYQQIQPLSEQTDKQYFSQLVNGVIEHVETIDNTILPHLTNSTYHLGEVEKAIMRIATYEIIFLSQEIDFAIAISEAVMIAKNYTADKSYTFINGVLDNIKAALINDERMGKR